MPLTDPANLRRLQRRTLVTLTITQMIGGTGVAIGIAVGALLAARMGDTAISGLAQSALVVGTALIAIPTTRIMTRWGRRPGLGTAYLLGTAGAVVVLVAASLPSLPLLFLGLFLFGGGSTANLQARYAAVDLAEPGRRGRQLSLVVWATTIGSVAGPNLAGTADDWVHRFGAGQYAGPFLFSALAFVLAALLVLVALRPDPLLTARQLAAQPPAPPDDDATDRTDSLTDRTDGSAVAVAPASTATAVARPASGLRAAAHEVRGSASARLGLAAMVVGHVVMVAVMAMTPVHIEAEGHPDTLRIVGLVISVHIAGMYALSPVTGWLSDRVGRRPVILGGVVLLVVACAVAGLSGHHTGGLAVGLFLLGLGWSGTMVAGSTLLTESVGLANRASVQGLADFVMGLGAAVAGAVAGAVVAWSSYTALTVVAAVVTVPLLAAALRPSRNGGSG